MQARAEGGIAMDVSSAPGGDRRQRAGTTCVRDCGAAAPERTGHSGPKAPAVSTARPVPDELTIGEVARRSGVPVSALRFYESKGLIKSRRSRGNHRLYPREVLRRIGVIKVAQRTGLSLEQIGAALDTLPEGRTPTKEDWARMSQAWKAELEARIARLVRLRDQLDRCIGCGCLSLTDCPLRNPDDCLAAEGAGPRLLEPCDGPADGLLGTAPVNRPGSAAAPSRCTAR